MSGTPRLSVETLSAGYGETLAVDAVSFALPASGMVALIGPNGAGKSTLIKAMLGLVTPLNGSTRIDGQPLAALRHRTAYVPQRASVDWSFPATAHDVVLQGMVHELRWFERFGRARAVEATALLAKVGMAELASRQIGALSGGQQQRVFLARGLARKADILFLDEPLAGVDAASEAIILAVLREQAEAGRLVIVVHHDLGTVADHFDHVLLMNRRLIAQGPVREVFRPDLLAHAYGVPLSVPDDPR